MRRFMLVRLRSVADRLLRLMAAAAVLSLAACAHPISIQANQLPEKTSQPSAKKVVYVMSEADRAKPVITEGGGGDKITYYPYRDFERALRSALLANYADVSAVDSAGNAAAIKQADASFVFVPDITTTSSSGSLLTWPPTQFSLTVSLDVLDPTGTSLTRVRATGNGAAEFSEFRGDFGLAGKRATEKAAQALADEIQRTDKLR